ncbi:unnamed protein product [Aureobasidium pullulans]|nr:unnamed protein product [Aureobasidium pullulans]
MAPKKGSGIGSAPARPINIFFTTLNRTNAAATPAVTSRSRGTSEHDRCSSRPGTCKEARQVYFGFARDNRSRNLNMLVTAIDAGLRLEPGVKENYTPSKGRVKHVLDLSPHPNRLVNQVWHLPVRDFSDPTSPTIIPFTLDPRGEKPILTGAALRATGVSKAHGGYPIPADCLLEGDMGI